MSLVFGVSHGFGGIPGLENFVFMPAAASVCSTAAPSV